MSSQTEETQKEESVSREVILGCALLSAFYTLVIAVVFSAMLSPLPVYLRWPLRLLWIVLCVKFYPSIHAHIGQAVSSIAIRQSKKIDVVYATAENSKWGNWSRDKKIMFGTNWPVTWVWLIVLAVAVAIGESFRAVWKIR
jgi:hypothetical protein